MFFFVHLTCRNSRHLGCWMRSAKHVYIRNMLSVGVPVACAGVVFCCGCTQRQMRPRRIMSCTFCTATDTNRSIRCRSSLHPLTRLPLGKGLSRVVLYVGWLLCSRIAHRLMVTLHGVAVQTRLHGARKRVFLSESDDYSVIALVCLSLLFLSRDLPLCYAPCLLTRYRRVTRLNCMRCARRLPSATTFWRIPSACCDGSSTMKKSC